MATHTDIIAQLISLREARGLSQAFVAESIGVDQAVVSNWETRKRTPKGPALKVLQDFIKTEMRKKPEAA